MSDEIEFNEIQPKNKLILFKENMALWFNGHRRVVTIVTIVAIVSLLILVGLLIVTRRNAIVNHSGNGQIEDPTKHEISPPSGKNVTPTPSEEAKTEVSPLDGVLITKTKMQEMQKKKVLGVMIDNALDARPQNGLASADLVYEALAEGGIPRFLAFYYRGSSDKVGPVRSIRSYFLDWLGEYDDSLFMHIGGSGGPGVDPSVNALEMIQRLGLKSVGISLGGNFWRDSSLHAAPHNAYTSTEILWKGAERLNWVGPVNLEKWLFKDDLVLANRPASFEISFQWGGWGDNKNQVKWIYDQVNNIYLREQGGQKQIDDNTKEQLKAKNIIIQYEVQTLVNDEKHHINYATIGSGKVLVFRDGRVIEGTWSKTSAKSRTQYLDLDGNEIKFNRGQTWIEMVPKDSPVSYK